MPVDTALYYDRGSKMALLNGSADRDGRHFPDADRFDVRRDIDRHLAFGYGTHFCMPLGVAARGQESRALPIRDPRGRRATIRGCPRHSSC